MRKPVMRISKFRLLKSLVPAFLLIATSSMLIGAQKLETKDQIKIVVSIDKKDAIYKTDEKIKFSISLLKGEVPLVGMKINYQIRRDGAKPEKGTIMSASQPVIVETSLPHSGFVLLIADYMTEAGKKFRGLAGAGVEPLGITPGAAPPVDFDEFWDNKIKKLKSMPLDAKLTPVEVPKQLANKVELYDVNINCLGGKPVSGYFAKPIGAKSKSLPAFISFHGAGVYSSSKISSRALLNKGTLAMDINAHGIDNGQASEFYKALREGELKGYPYFNSDDREKSYFLGMFLRAYRAMQFLKSQPEWDGETLIVYGSSQGGGQALAAAGLDPQVSFCVAKVPALCDHFGSNKKRSNGWPQFVYSASRMKKNVEKVKECSGYFDAANFASRIKGRAILTVGFIDTCCCPSSVYATYNNIKGEKEIINNVSLGHRNCPVAAKTISKKINDYLKK